MNIAGKNNKENIKVGSKYYADDFLIKSTSKKNFFLYGLDDKNSFNKWFGFSVNKNLSDTFDLYNMDKDFLKYTESEFNSLSFQIQSKIIFYIRKLSLKFRNKIYIKIINRLTNNRVKLIDTSTITGKHDLFFLKFFNNFCIFHNVNLKNILSCDVMSYDFINSDNNFLNALKDFQECMCSVSKFNRVATYTISNFINWFNDNGKKILNLQFLKQLKYHNDDFFLNINNNYMLDSLNENNIVRKKNTSQITNTKIKVIDFNNNNTNIPELLGYTFKDYLNDDLTNFFNKN
jgi:hypothetical protein